MYIHRVCVYIFTGYRLCRRPLRLESLRIGCLELHVALDGDLWAWMAMTLGSILESLASFGSLLGRLWVACGLHWVRQGAPMSYLALLCRREHQFEGPGGPKGSMWGLEVCHPEKACGPGLRRAVTPLRWSNKGFLQSGMLGCLDAWMPGGVSGLEGFGDAGLEGIGDCSCKLARSSSGEVGGYRPLS